MPEARNWSVPEARNRSVPKARQQIAPEACNWSMPRAHDPNVPHRHNKMQSPILLTVQKRVDRASVVSAWIAGVLRAPACL